MMDKVYKAISDGTRRTILKLLRERDMTAGEIAGHFDLTKPTLSKHFAVLREAGLVTDEKKGRNITYRLNPELLETALVSLMEDYSFFWTPPVDVEAFVGMLKAGQYADAVSTFDDTMASLMSASQLQQAWNYVNQQGGRDYQVTEADFKIWQSALSSRTDVTFKLYPDLNHLFVTGVGKATPEEYNKPGNVAQQVVDDIASWIGAH